MSMSDPAALFMQSFVELIAETARRRRLKMGDFANLVWPEMTPRSARQRWQYMRREIPGKGRSLDMTLVEAYKMAQILGQDLNGLFLRAKDRADQALEEAEHGAKGRASLKPKESRRKSDN
jgi:hypothetical protein